MAKSTHSTNPDIPKALAANSTVSPKLDSLSSKIGSTSTTDLGSLPVCVPVSPEKTLQKRSPTEKLDSLSIGKNSRLKKEGTESFAVKFATTKNTTTSVTVARNISELSINQYNLSIVLLVHHKFQKNGQGTVGKFLGYDNNGDSVNVVFYRQTITALDGLEEGQYLKITYGRVKPANLIFSLATSKYDIEMTNPKNMKVVEQSDFNIPFRSIKICDIIDHGEINSVFDCIGKISVDNEGLADDQGRLKITINDGSGDIDVIAFDDESKQILRAAVGLQQNVFAFQRLKHNIFQNDIQLIFRDGAEVLTMVDDARFLDLLKSDKKLQDV